MKTQILGLATSALLLTASCQNAEKKESNADAISKEAIAVHDEIMPQIAVFDKHTIVIDSLLGNMSAVKATNTSLDTAATRTDLTQLKSELEAATDKMMTWMKEYEPTSADTSYQKAELESISQLKAEFDSVTKKADSLLPALVK
ncbi:transposase [Sphingobacterium oryzagri]|uniref:Transposase n=1 Tax=Sphingobacterium oryzagri TaxID=3025669 RepID=A0ABY7WNI1_9SPHI|nr:transposase [Sphingobacterium sp. KACC 22765]WDF69971.1 transposase [Sphingobacterium sp. KACC 22765]